MIERTHSESVVFRHPFELKGVDRPLPPGDYRVVTDEEMIEGVSFPVYRRVSTMIFVPGPYASSIEMHSIDPFDLQAAQDRDAAAEPSSNMLSTNESSRTRRGAMTDQSIDLVPTITDRRVVIQRYDESNP
jgi:hypothetical protein